ncbi:MAG: outer membrane beta-barrel protein [Rikenellaceae bacterium]
MNKFFKAVLMLTVALSATTFMANAQLYYGVTAGGNVSSFKLTDAANTELAKSNLGYQAGITAGIDLAIIEVGAELLWVHNRMDVDGYDSDNYITSNSIELPVLASLRILGPLSIKAGPSFILYNEGKAHYGDGFEYLGSVKSNLGYVVGLGANIWKLTLDVRYNGQFEKGTVLGYEVTDADYNINCNSFSASIGYRF